MKLKDFGYFIGRTVMFCIPIYIIFYVWKNRYNSTISYLEGVCLIVSAVYIMANEFKIVKKDQQEGDKDV